MIVDNATLVITKTSGITVTYNGVIANTKEEVKSLIHPDYWNEVPVGFKRVFNDGLTLIHLSNNIMLIRKDESRYFVSITPILTDYIEFECN